MNAEIVRDKIMAGVCPICEAGPFKVVAAHVSLKHGINKKELRALAELPRCEKICSEETSERHKEVRKGQVWRKGLLDSVRKEAIAASRKEMGKTNHFPVVKEHRARGKADDWRTRWESFTDNERAECVSAMREGQKKWAEEHPEEVKKHLVKIQEGAKKYWDDPNNREHRHRKVPLEDRAKIIDRLNRGESQQEIAREYGCTPRAIRFIREREAV
jgi:hypothetical protein